MYLPAWFREDTPSVLQELIRRYSFGMLVTAVDDQPFITHVPFVLHADRGEFGSLSTHLARANPHWELFEPNKEVLVVFQGPHAYVSSLLYGDQPAAPTWNYAVVHARGIPHILEGDELVQSLHAMVAAYEPHPERLDMPNTFFEEMIESLVGIEITLTGVTGKFKLSQNRPGDRPRIAETFASSGDPAIQDLAQLMGRRSEVE